MTALANKIKITPIYKDLGYTTSVDRHYTGHYITIPAKSYCAITARAIYNHSPVEWIGISTALPVNMTEYSVATFNNNSGIYHATVSLNDYAETETNFYIWSKEGTDNRINGLLITGFIIQTA